MRSNCGSGYARPRAPGADDLSGEPVPDQRGPAAGIDRLTPAASAVRGSARRRIDRAVGAWFPIAQTAVAAGVAWYLARLIVGQPLPFFAPASAVVSLGVARGQPRRRAVELCLG